MRNLAPSRALARRKFQWLLFAFFMIAIGVLAVVIGLAMTALPLVAPTNRAYGLYTTTANLLFLLGGVVALAGVGVALRGATWREENDLAKMVGNSLAGFLDDRYTLIRNVSKIGLRQTFYIDAVLVGLQGVLVFRIIDQSGMFLNEADRWLKMNTRDRKWYPARIDPTREAVADMKSLQDYLARRGLPAETPIFGVVVFVRDAPMVQFAPARNPALPATTLSGVFRELQGSYFARERISKGAADAIAQLLSEV